LVVTLLCLAATWQFAELPFVLIPGFVFLWLLLIFRDPVREVPAVPLGVLSPVDGRIIDVSLTDKGVLGGEAHRILVRVNSLGTYTARCPVEGKIMDFRCAESVQVAVEDTNGLWVRTDEKADVVLQFRAHRFGLAPLAFQRFGERVGQGHRCAYLRLTRIAEVQIPMNSRILVEKGQKVAAAEDVLAKLPHSQN